MNDGMTLEDLKRRFSKICINANPAYTYARDDKGETIQSPMLYKRADLCKWAQEAFDRGEQFFFTELEDPKKPNGPLRLCEAKYAYRMNGLLSEEEFRSIFGAEETE